MKGGSVLLENGVDLFSCSTLKLSNCSLCHYLGKRENAARRADILEAAFGMPGDHICQILCYAYKPAAGSPEKRDKRWKQYNLIIDGRSFFDLPKVFDLGAKGLVMQMSIQEDILPPSYIGDWDESTHSAPTVSMPDERLVKNAIQSQIDKQRRILEERRKAAASRNCSHAESSISSNYDTSNLINRIENLGIHEERSEPKLIKQERSYLVIENDQEDTIPTVFSAAPSELKDAMTRQNNAYCQQQEHLKIAQNAYSRQQHPVITSGQDPRQLPQIKISGEQWQSSPTDGFPSQQPINVTVIPQGSQLRPNDQALVPQTAQMNTNNLELVQQRNQLSSGSQAIVPQRTHTTSNKQAIGPQNPHTPGINQAIVSQRFRMSGNKDTPKMQGQNGALVTNKPQMQGGQGNNGAFVSQTPQTQGTQRNHDAIVPQRPQMQEGQGSSGALITHELQMRGGQGNNGTIVHQRLQIQENIQSLVSRCARDKHGGDLTLVPQRPQMQGNSQSLVPQGARNIHGSNQALVLQRNENGMMSQRSQMNSLHPVMVPQTNTSQQNLVPGTGPLNPHQPPTYDEITLGLMGIYNGTAGRSTSPS